MDICIQIIHYLTEFDELKIHLVLSEILPVSSAISITLVPHASSLHYDCGDSNYFIRDLGLLATVYQHKLNTYCLF